MFQVWVCPIRIRALDEMMDRQKLMRMTERSDRMYLQKWTNEKRGDCLSVFPLSPPPLRF